jgi:hypothetical protein
MPLEITQESRTFRLIQPLIEWQDMDPEIVASEDEMRLMKDLIQSKCLVTFISRALAHVHCRKKKSK